MFTPVSSKKPYYPESCPVASSIRYKFKKKDGSDLSLYWMDGGIMPERFEEIDPDADMTCTMGDLDMMDVEGATVFVGTKVCSCGWVVDQDSGRRGKGEQETFIRQRREHSS